MIVEQDVTLIVAVCKLEENGRPKCHQYWPEGSSDTDPNFKNLLAPGMRVKQTGSVKLGGTLESRNFEVTAFEGTIHKVKQLHYVGWPDHGVPTGTSIEDFTLMLNELILMLLNSLTS